MGKNRQKLDLSSLSSLVESSSTEESLEEVVETVQDFSHTGDGTPGWVVFSQKSNEKCIEETTDSNYSYVTLELRPLLEMTKVSSAKKCWNTQMGTHWVCKGLSGLATNYGVYTTPEAAQAAMEGIDVDSLVSIKRTSVPLGSSEPDYGWMDNRRPW